jgi:hypothetical protein
MDPMPQNAKAWTLADFFKASPLRDSGLEIERPQDGARELDL